MKRAKSSIIGSTQLIGFPELEYTDIPAKIDTGADTSSLWASDVTVTPEGLQFILFDKGSRFFTGRHHVASDYRATTVKNSSGDMQLRYMVHLLVRVGNRRIRAWFTLADRSRMRYPVLLGRRLLKGKFIVDVTKRQEMYTEESPARVLVLASESKNRIQDFADNLAKHLKTNAQVVVRHYASLAFEVESDKVSVRETVTMTDLADYDFVYFKSHRRYYEFATAVARYLAVHDVQFVDNELSSHVSYDKLAEALSLALAGVPVPPTYCASRDVLQGQYEVLGARFGIPFVCKEINADRGRKNYLISSQESFDEIIAGAGKLDVFLIQRYIENEGYIRAFVFGTKVGTAVERTAVDHADPLKQHLNNPAGGGNARLLEQDAIPSAVHDYAVRAASIMNRQVAGVDLLQDKHTKEWFVLEANSSPQLMSGSYVAEKQEALAEYIDSEFNR